MSVVLPLAGPQIRWKGKVYVVFTINSPCSMVVIDDQNHLWELVTPGRCCLCSHDPCKYKLYRKVQRQELPNMARLQMPYFLKIRKPRTTVQSRLRKKVWSLVRSLTEW